MGRISQNFHKLSKSKKIFPSELSTFFQVDQAPQEPSPNGSSMPNIIPNKELEDTSPIFQASQAKYPQ